MSFYLSSSRCWALHLLPPRVFRHHVHGRCPTLRAWNLQMYTKHRTWYVHCKKQHFKQHIVEINFSAEVFIKTIFTYYLLLVKYVTIFAEQFHFLKFTTKILNIYTIIVDIHAKSQLFVIHGTVSLTIHKFFDNAKHFKDNPLKILS